MVDVDVADAMLYSLACRLAREGLRMQPATTAAHMRDRRPPILLPAMHRQDRMATTTLSVASHKGNVP
jgi:hypothetical protein